MVRIKSVIKKACDIAGGAGEASKKSASCRCNAAKVAMVLALMELRRAWRKANKKEDERGDEQVGIRRWFQN